MTKEIKNVLISEEIAERRAENLPKLFNMTMALKAIETTAPRASKSGALGELTVKIKEIFEAAGTPLAVNQVKAALVAGGMEVTSKQVADRMWTISTKNKKASHPILKAGSEAGMYELA